MIPLPQADRQEDAWSGVFVANNGKAVLIAQDDRHAGESQLHLWVGPEAAAEAAAGSSGSWTQLPGWPKAHAAETTSSASKRSSTIIDAVFEQPTPVTGLWVSCAAATCLSDGSIDLSAVRQPAPSSAADADSQQQQNTWRTLKLRARAARKEDGEQQHHQQGKEEAPATSENQEQLDGQIELELPPADDEGPPAAGKCSHPVLAWQPDGNCLAVGVAGSADSSNEGCWVLLISPTLELLHQCAWHNAVGKPVPAAGLLTTSPTAQLSISSLVWLHGAEATLAAVDSFGQLALLRYTAAGGGSSSSSGGTLNLEKLQVMDPAGITITPRPSLTLPASMLAAAARGSIKSLHALLPEREQFALACLPLKPLPASAGTALPMSSKYQAGPPVCRLAIFNGRDVVVCDCYPGCNPSRQSIEDTISPKVRNVFFDRDNSQLHSKGSGNFISTPGASISGAAAAGNELGADGLVTLQLVRRKPGDAEAEKEGGGGTAGSSEPPAVSRLWQQLSSADAAFVEGRWAECEATYRELLPLTSGHLCSVGA